MDYGFHAPTVSFPVPGTLMIEPTESEPQGGTRPVLRRADRHSRRDPGVIDGKADREGQRAEERAAHGGSRQRVGVDAPLHARAGGVPAAVRARRKFWPSRRPHRQSVRRPPPDVRVRADRGLRGPSRPRRGGLVRPSGSRTARPRLTGRRPRSGARPELGQQAPRRSVPAGRADATVVDGDDRGRSPWSCSSGRPRRRCRGRSSYSGPLAHRHAAASRASSSTKRPRDAGEQARVQRRGHQRCRSLTMKKFDCEHSTISPL